MNITQKYITENPCYKQGGTITPKGIIVHSLGVAQPSADVIFGTFNKSTAKTAVHAIVDTDKVYQIMPWNYRSWGCGSGNKGSGNNTHIQFEICEPAGHKYLTGSNMIGYDVKKQQSYFNAVWDNSVELATYLCKEYKLSPDTIICHSEAYKQGIASNHGDVMHWFPKHGKSMDDFRKAVADRLSYKPNGNITPESSVEAVKWLQEQLNKAKLSVTPIPVTGKYCPMTRIGVLLYWESKGWKRNLKEDGTNVATNTINALAKL